MTVAIVTGASGRLGQAITTELVKHGAAVVMVGRNKARLLATTQAILSQHPSAKLALAEADLQDMSAARRIVDIASQFGRLDILVNNAAVQGPIGPSWEIPHHQHEETMRINFNAPVELMRACIPHMIRNRGGSIVNISGGGATSPRAMFSAYAASKTALVRFSETLATETEPLGITVNCIAPGAFRSAMTEAVLRAGGKAGNNELATANNLLQKPNEVPQQAAQLVAYLTMGEGRSITGKLISAVWDDWKALHKQELGKDIYTLRRIAS